MSLSIGIVGLPNVGKSTLFNALLKRQQALAANYPFATIEPNVGMVPVPDERLEKLAKTISNIPLADGQPPLKGDFPPIKPAIVKFLDIAGLIKGASEGEGLGNKFLAHIRETDLICHVIRDFSDTSVLREGSVEAKADLETIQTELLLADLETLEKQKAPKGAVSKEEKLRYLAIERFLAAASGGKQIREVLHDDFDRKVAKELSLLTSKPELFVVNTSEEALHTKSVAEYADLLGVNSEQIIIISARIESELSSLADEDQAAYLKDLGLEKSGLERLIESAYIILGLQSFLTAGEKEVRAWTIPVAAIAVDAAGVIHTDFAKKFIKAKIASYSDFIELGGWKAVGEAGKLRQEGRDYIMQEGDVVEFMIGA